MKEMLETGVHFGHKRKNWNPKMVQYIFTERKGIHIIDLEQTIHLFEKAYFFIRDLIAGGGEILFVGTKKQVRLTIEEEARRCGAHYINNRWIGGILTNFVTVKKSIERMKKLEQMAAAGELEMLPNQEAAKLNRILVKLQQRFSGLRNLTRIPDAIYVIDTEVEATAVHEALICGIPIIAMVDTNCDPDLIAFPIPSNDDAIKATKLITSRIADAVLEGLEGRQTEAAVTEESAKELSVEVDETEKVETTTTPQGDNTQPEREDTSLIAMTEEEVFVEKGEPVK
ncbi:30S ribosomal protein S2 [Candidatus Acetothermia bacterium]|nr:30S ribosomal protein S2 [Candidatus Acetothermia bacterium]